MNEGNVKLFALVDEVNIIKDKATRASRGSTSFHFNYGLSYLGSIDWFTATNNNSISSSSFVTSSGGQIEGLPTVVIVVQLQTSTLQ
ncbi:hypothetical protein V6N11_083588 [Hibiscus sabdariffa]|uniref:Dirigent protein n=1 Tax=Hibiscus sabdariffa TaxID=183260 RepID=A0ABR2QCA5_9ROSI